MISFDTGQYRPFRTERLLAALTFTKAELDEVFPKPAIREVAFEIRFPTRLRVNAELWKLQDEIVSHYPIVTSESALLAGSSPLSVSVFQNPASGRLLKVSQENFAVVFTRYSRFEDFKDEVLDKVNRFCNKFEITVLGRVGLRYVNNIITEGNPSEVLRYVRPIADFERIPISCVDQFVTEVRLRERGHLVTLRGVLLAPFDDGRRIYVLDIDCYTERETGIEAISRLLDSYHETAQAFFLDHITEEYKNVMRGRS